MSEEKKTYLIDSVDDADKPEVELVGRDENAFSIMGRISTAWRRTKHHQKNEIIKEYQERSTSGDYNNLLAVAMEYIREPEPEEEEEYDDWDYEKDDTDDWGEGEE